jgi:hypothetical protein
MNKWVAGETEAIGENLSSADLSTTNLTCPDLGSNSDGRGGKPATNRLSYGKAWNQTKTDFPLSYSSWNDISSVTAELNKGPCFRGYNPVYSQLDVSERYVCILRVLQ